MKHGLASSYNGGCRCARCRAAKMTARRAYRERARAANTPAYQRELAAGRARKETYRGTCEECGAPTNGCNGPSKASRICATCAPSYYGPIQSARQRGNGPVVSEILTLLNEKPTGLPEIVATVGITPVHASVAINRLLKYGLAERVSRGVYRATERTAA